MNKKTEVKVSKRLSLILRHAPESVGLRLDENGWVGVESLITALNKNGMKVSRESIAFVVANNQKRRFEFDETGENIRARQGHSVAVDLEYQPMTPPDILFHGTADRFLDSIFKEGLTKQQRHHVHMSIDTSLMLEVGRRHGKAVLLQIDAKAMHAQGHEFFVTGNDVWLTDHIPPQFLTEPGNPKT